MRDSYKAIREWRRFERLFPELYHKMGLVKVDCQINDHLEAAYDIKRVERLIRQCKEAICKVEAEI